MASRHGPQKDYLEGLDNLRKMISNTEIDIDKAKLDFYCTEENNEDKYEEYLKLCNDKLLYCNNKLRKHNVKLQVVDSEVALVSILNKVRDLEEDIDPDVLSYLSEFWEHIKLCLERIRGLANKFDSTILKRLTSSCISYNNGGIQNNLTTTYTAEVKKYQTQITETLNKVRTLIKSFSNAIKQELFTNTNFSERILVACDQKAFPVLRLVPDVTEKLEHVCRLSKQWIDKDETYIHDISNHIRETRSRTRRKEEDLRSQKEKQDHLNKTVEDAYSLCKTNKEKLQQIESELQTMADQVYSFSESKKCKTEEKRKKEGMVGFLDISITQTKKNYSLQLKKSRLMRQVKELEQSLEEIEKELSHIQSQSVEKSQEKVLLKEKFEESDTSYRALKTELDKFTANVDKLQQEVTNLTESLTELEIIQTFKTSPEKVEDFYDRPSTVKLAPSLKEKIQQRKRKLQKNKPR